MTDEIDIKKKYTRTRSSNLKELSAALGKKFSKSHIKTLEISVDNDGEWTFYRRNMDEVVINKFRLGQTFYYMDDFGQNVVGVVTVEQNKFIFHGNIENDENTTNPTLIIIWDFTNTTIIQTTSLIWNVGLSGIFVKSEEIFESDQHLIYRGEFRSKLRPFIDTKLPQNLVSPPERIPAPADWCSCASHEESESDEEEDDNDRDILNVDPLCAAHGMCDECEKTNEFCDCDWFYDEHFCVSCGLTLWQCDCNHVVEIIEKLYEF